MFITTKAPKGIEYRTVGILGEENRRTREGRKPRVASLGYHRNGQGRINRM